MLIFGSFRHLKGILVLFTFPMIRLGLFIVCGFFESVHGKVSILRKCVLRKNA